MTKRIEKLLRAFESGEYKKRRVGEINLSYRGVTSLEEGMPVLLRGLSAERPMLIEGDTMGFYRSTAGIQRSPDGNITPSYYRIITQGFDAVRGNILKALSLNSDSEKRKYGEAMLECLDACTRIAEEHRALAKESGDERLYNALMKIPACGAETFYEACVFIKMCIYFLRMGFASHVGLGRFDQYMYPFYKADRERGISDEEIFETVEEFFISLNFDSDLYQGVQQGDNGQSMVLGGFTADGSPCYNELTRMCLRASLELNLIDPKINLRVGKNTPPELYELGTLLTKQGLGFPQYCNDDVVIPGLMKLGYAEEDAENYVVAACWEYIIPNCGADIPNIGTMDFPAVINRAIRDNLESSDSFDVLMKHVKEYIRAQVDEIVREKDKFIPSPNPLMSIFVDGCTEKLSDMWKCGKYRNYGCHGAGIANAADALAAVRKTVYDDRKVAPRALISALDSDFCGYDDIRRELRAAPKMGNNDDYVDGVAAEIMDCFATAINGRKNKAGGVWRAGTGSAMEYIWKGERCPATADGRKAGEPYSSSFSPSLDVKTDGVLSVISSFTKFDMTNIINGGPLTLEIHDAVFRNDIGIEKVASLARSFINLGGHQLQLNSVNRDKLLDAQAHPEKYPNLIVRVWGWSGRFCELDVAYQNHIIRRTEYV